MSTVSACKNCVHNEPVKGKGYGECHVELVGKFGIVSKSRYVFDGRPACEKFEKSKKRR